MTMLTEMTVSAQNQTDGQGRKTGHWIVNYPDGGIQYEADFIAGKPAGLMKRYDKSGNLAAEMLFEKKGKRCDATLYYPNGKIAAEGIFLDRDKDSVWNYYAEEDGSIRITENWKNGKLDGQVTSYYPGGEISEITEWRDGVKNGPWIQYFENGEKKTTCSYNSGLKDGPYLTFYPDGSTELEGSFTGDLFNGTWKYFNEEGELVLTLKYDNGKILNKDDLIGKDEELLKKIEDNAGNIPDPALGNY